MINSCPHIEILWLEINNIYSSNTTTQQTHFNPNSGTAAILSMGSPTQPTIVSTIKIKGRVFTSSYEEETAAMEAALQWIYTNANSVQTSIFICTDSQYYVRHSHHATLKPHPFVNAYHPFHHPFSYNGYWDTPKSLAMTS